MYYICCLSQGRNFQERWRTHFPVKWIFAKDLPNRQLQHITLPNSNKPVAACKDAQVGGKLVCY